MKNLLILIFAISTSIYFAGCGENSVVDGLKKNETPTISGRIQNWHQGSGKKLYFTAFGGDSVNVSVILDSCAIDSLGNFSLKLMVPADSVLTLFKLNDSMCTIHTVINPPGLKYSYAQFYVGDSLHSNSGIVFRSSDSLTGIFTGKIVTYMYYFNASGSISGTDTCLFLPSVFIEYNQVTQTKGWNSVNIVYDSYDTSLVKLTITTVQQNVRWYYFPYLTGKDMQGKFYRKDPVRSGMLKK